MKMSISTSLRVFAPFAFGYFISYLYRVVNAVMAPDLAADMGVGPSELGLLTSVYFLTFGAFQAPLGVLLDRFGPRKVEAGLLVFAAAGAFIFSRADSVAGLVIGRGFIGFGVSACLMAAFSAFVMWFRSNRLPLVNGFVMAAGGLGALTATAPVEAALQITDWRGVFTMLAALTLVCACVIYLVVPDKKREQRGAGLREQVKGIGEVFTSPIFWRIAPWATMSQAAYLSIQGLWVGPWLRDVALLDRTTAANVLLLTAAAMVTGFISLGALAERLGKIGLRPIVVGTAGMGVFLGIQLLLVLELTSLTWPLWMLFGFFGSSGILCYAELSQRFPARLTGRANTSLNMMVFAASFAAQWGLGGVINLWPTGPDGGYAPPAYQASFGLMAILQVLGILWFIWMTLVRGKKKVSYSEL
ncbi:MAG: MFS transporter [Desulfobacterales bacterium]|nr:MFS transporter [Desulfobacterales bacterium]